MDDKWFILIGLSPAIIAVGYLIIWVVENL